MTLYDPPLERLRAIAARQGLSLDDEQLELLRGLGSEVLRACERIEHAETLRLPVAWPRTAGRPPTPGEDPLNAWAWRCEVTGAESGPLHGRTVALKDIIPLAGMPMTGGSALLQGHSANFDATVVTRVLDAGGTVTGIAATEDMCLSGASVSAVTGQVRNPRDPSRSAGGSSSGVAALVGSGAVDMGIGADQGGSIRIPGSLSGIYAMKPTYGLIPYTGCMPIDVSVDHLGPMAATVADVAALLGAIAGYDDGLDPRQRADVAPVDYSAAVADATVEGVRVGLVTEGFGHEGLSDPAVDALVREEIESLRALGATVEEVSVPEHLHAMDIHASILLQGGSEFMMRGTGIGIPGKGFLDPAVAEHLGRSGKTQADLLFASVKFAMVIGGYLWEQYGGAYYAKAQNLAVHMRRAYDAAFSRFDVLAMPTTCVTAPALPDLDAQSLDAVALALDPALISNTCAFNHTGHPALNVPIGPLDGLPVGLMLVGARQDDAAVLSAAAAIEAAGRTLAAAAAA
jgi:amidase